MNRWLRDGTGDDRDQPVKLYTNRELQVTASGHVDGEPGSRKVYQVILEEFRANKQPRSPAELVSELRRLGVSSNVRAPAVETVGGTEGKDYRLEQIRFESEPGVNITAKLYIPNAAGRKSAVMMVEEKRLPVPLFVQRSQSTAALAENLARSGRIVLELDPRDSPVVVDGRPFLGNWLTNERADLIGRNLAVMRAHDILTAVDVLAARPDVDAASIRGYAKGVKGFWLLMAAAVDPRLGKIWLDRTPRNFSTALEGPLASFLFDAMIPGFALHWDFADLTVAIGERRILWTDPTNWMNQVVSAGQAYRYRYVGENDDAYLEAFFR
jgi:hypothetical protein